MYDGGHPWRGRLKCGRKWCLISSVMTGKASAHSCASSGRPFLFVSRLGRKKWWHQGGWRLCQIQLLLITLRHQDMGTLCQPHVVMEPAGKPCLALCAPEAISSSGPPALAQVHRALEAGEGGLQGNDAPRKPKLLPVPGPSTLPGNPPAAKVHALFLSSACLEVEGLTGHGPAGGEVLCSLQLGRPQGLPQDSCF